MRGGCHHRTLLYMKKAALILAIALVIAGCIARAAGNGSNMDAFDESLANFQHHLRTCPYPAAHAMQFARSWDIPEFVIHAYVPKDVTYDKGKTTD